MQPDAVTHLLGTRRPLSPCPASGSGGRAAAEACRRPSGRERASAKELGHGAAVTREPLCWPCRSSADTSAIYSKALDVAGHLGKFLEAGDEEGEREKRQHEAHVLLGAPRGRLGVAVGGLDRTTLESPGRLALAKEDHRPPRAPVRGRLHDQGDGQVQARFRLLVKAPQPHAHHEVISLDPDVNQRQKRPAVELNVTVMLYS